MATTSHNESIIAPQRATIALKNLTKITLQIKNNMIISFGPKKGQWVIHQEFHLAPGACIVTAFLVDQTHQLMIYEASQNTGGFLYMIRDTDVEDDTSLELHDDHYKVTQGLSC
jgi:hypothetical protein